MLHDLSQLNEKSCREWALIKDAVQVQNLRVKTKFKMVVEGANLLIDTYLKAPSNKSKAGQLYKTWVPTTVEGSAELFHDYV